LYGTIIAVYGLALGAAMLHVEAGTQSCVLLGAVERARSPRLAPRRRRLHQQAVKLSFYRGASLKDRNRLFNSSLPGTTRRSSDLHEGEKINEAAFRPVMRAAVAANSAARARRAGSKNSTTKKGQPLNQQLAFFIQTPFSALTLPFNCRKTK
jgi:hypothetical protein